MTCWLPTPRGRRPATWVAATSVMRALPLARGLGEARKPPIHGSRGHRNGMLSTGYCRDCPHNGPERRVTPVTIAVRGGEIRAPRIYIQDHPAPSSLRRRAAAAR